MSQAAAPVHVVDRVSNVLKWVLLAVAVLSFALMAWTTLRTYRNSPGIPDRMVAADGIVLMTSADIVAGKAGFQKADLMDYGSLYGMGSYYGQDYTASILHHLGVDTQERVAQAHFGKPFAQLGAGDQAAATAQMRSELQGVDLSGGPATIPPELAASMAASRDEVAKYLLSADQPAGWVPAYSLSPDAAKATADFMVYSALTTVARRPGLGWSWTENWPNEPLVGNTPTSNTFLWTWISFCFTFFCFGLVLFIYEF
jgi:nitric oxide reductase subunit B